MPESNVVEIDFGPFYQADAECPKCGTMKGVFIYATQPRRELVWGCQCGCQLFYVMHEGVQCFRCAKIFSYSDLVED